MEQEQAPLLISFVVVTSMFLKVNCDIMLLQTLLICLWHTNYMALKDNEQCDDSIDLALSVAWDQNADRVSVQRP